MKNENLASWRKENERGSLLAMPSSAYASSIWPAKKAERDVGAKQNDVTVVGVDAE